MYNQGYRPQPGQTKSGYYDTQGNWYAPPPGPSKPAQPKRRASGPPPQRSGKKSRRKGQETAQKAQPQMAAL